MRLGLAWPALLTLAFLPGVAGAQPRPLPALVPAPAGTPAQRAEGVEIGVGSMVVTIFPAFGGHVSVPASRRVRLEVGAHALTWPLEDGDDIAVVTQVQVRIPFRRGPPGSRRSLLLGATAFTVGDRVDSSGEWDFDTGARPHAGIGWQWQKSRHLDLRIDVQGIFTGTYFGFADRRPVVVPFATFSMVWHRERRWS
jgi:hypothetical protein